MVAVAVAAAAVLVVVMLTRVGVYLSGICVCILCLKRWLRVHFDSPPLTTSPQNQTCGHVHSAHQLSDALPLSAEAFAASSASALGPLSLASDPSPSSGGNSGHPASTGSVSPGASLCFSDSTSVLLRQRRHWVSFGAWCGDFGLQRGLSGSLDSSSSGSARGDRITCSTDRDFVAPDPDSRYHVPARNTTVQSVTFPGSALGGAFSCSGLAFVLGVA